MKKAENANEMMASAEDLSEAFDAFAVERARFKSDLPRLPGPPVKRPDPFRFVQGAPLLDNEALLTLTDSWEQGTGRFLAAIQRGFPHLSHELQALKAALDEGWLDPGFCARVLLDGKERDMSEMAFAGGMDSRTARFVLLQLIKPCIEKRAHSLKPLIENLTWTKGYCPICGSLAEMGFLLGEERDRWLMCALCGHRWRFTAALCPFCENSDPDRMEWFFIKDRDHELVELCHRCKRYLLCIDDQRRPKDASWEGSMGLVHLDVIAQRMGFLPVAVSAWNILAAQGPSDPSASSAGAAWAM